MLHMAARVIWGPLRTPPIEHGEPEDHAQADQGQAATPGHDAPALPADIGGREIAVLVPLALLVVVLGVMPNLVLKPIKQPIELIRTPIAANPSRPVRAAAELSLAPSPGTPGEGRGEGAVAFGNGQRAMGDRQFEEPSPQPSP